jgi:hypothetical protein
MNEAVDGPPLAGVVLTVVPAVAIRSSWKDWSNATGMRLSGRTVGAPPSRPTGSQTAAAGSAERSATVQRTDFACNIGAPVMWRVDETDRVVALASVFHEEGYI